MCSDYHIYKGAGLHDYTILNLSPQHALEIKVKYHVLRYR
jgi:hypothetical protein